jgi:hypothetical protein
MSRFEISRISGLEHRQGLIFEIQDLVGNGRGTFNTLWLEEQV